MAKNRIVELLKEAQTLAASKYGIGNILQPGIIKEMIMAEILDHQLITEKGSADAMDKYGTYEYLASIRRVGVKTNIGCSFQMDRMTEGNINRVTRNSAFYFGIFKSHLEIEEIWKVEIPAVLGEVERQIEKSKNSISHVNFLLKWLEENGKKVFFVT
jgi:hypothetical protein